MINLAQMSLKGGREKMEPSPNVQNSHPIIKHFNVLEKLIFEGPSTIFNTERKVNQPHSTTSGIFKDLLNWNLIEIVEENRFRTGLTTKKYGPTTNGLFRFLQWATSEMHYGFENADLVKLYDKYKAKHWIFNEYSFLNDRNAKDLGIILFQQFIQHFGRLENKNEVEQKKTTFSILNNILYPEQYFKGDTRNDSFNDFKLASNIIYNGSYDQLRTYTVDYLKQRPEILFSLIEKIENTISDTEKNLEHNKQEREKFVSFADEKVKEAFEALKKENFELHKFI
jgi:hypothetical protein